MQKYKILIMLSLFMLILLTVSVSASNEITIIFHAIECDDESDLPNWGISRHAINGNTAQNYVNTHAGCELESGWKFQWREYDSTIYNPGDNLIGPASGWQTSSTTNSNGRTAKTIEFTNPNSSIWFREVMNSDYIPFSGSGGWDLPNNVNPVGAEFYCETDVRNYDNYEAIEFPQDGRAYDCIAFNVPKGNNEPEPVCGNNILETGEACDDGNNVNGDGCSSTCQKEEPKPECAEIPLNEDGIGYDDGGRNHETKGTICIKDCFGPNGVPDPYLLQKFGEDYWADASYFGTDYCVSGTVLHEYSCEDGKTVDYDYNCGPDRICQAGACITPEPEPECTLDTDSGANKGTKGQVFLYDKSLGIDFCIGDYHLNEYICVDNKYSEYVYDCSEYGMVCDKGACVTPEEPEVTDLAVIDITWTPAEPEVGDMFQNVGVTIENQGDVAVNQNSVYLDFGLSYTYGGFFGFFQSMYYCGTALPFDISLNPGEQETYYFTAGDLDHCDSFIEEDYTINVNIASVIVNEENVANNEREEYFSVEESEEPLPECSDGIDNDGDNLIDYPNDPGCDSLTDDDEYNEPVVTYECSDGIDNDNNGFIDYPKDHGCTGPQDNSEYEEVVEKGELKIVKIDAMGYDYYYALAGSYMFVSTTLKNTGTDDIDDLEVGIVAPGLGIRETISYNVDIDDGDRESVHYELYIPKETKPGEYYLGVFAYNEEVRRTKYVPIVITETYEPCNCGPESAVC
ncbi:MAG: myxococcus cysteine-rich repeat containing protein [archaeon]